MTNRKPLEDMTLKELWELFPIVLIPHRTEWKEWADSEMAELFAILGPFSPTINHIGSTAIPLIQAKPIVDILVELPDVYDLNSVRRILEENGYICMSVAKNRMSFNKGYTPDGYAERVFHIHVHRIGDNDEIYFRDYLISHPDIAKEYEALKLGLLPTYRNNRDGYTEAKSEFVKCIINQAKLLSFSNHTVGGILKWSLDNLEGVVETYSWGERGIFYNPGGVLKRGIYILTIKEKDGENDSRSQLNRDGVWRLNIGLRKSTFRSLFGELPERPVKGGVVNMPYDFSAIDVIMPHPVYAWMGWICVLNPSGETFERVKSLILESYEYAKEKFRKRKK